MDLGALGTISPELRLSHICPLSTYVLMVAIDWNPGNQNFQKIQNRYDFPDQGELSVTELLLAALPLASIAPALAFYG